MKCAEINSTLVKSITQIFQYHSHHHKLIYVENSIITISSSTLVIWQDHHVLKIWLSSYSTYSIHNHNKIIINVDQMIKLSCSQNMIIIIFNLFTMIHDHNKIISNLGHMIKLQWPKQIEKLWEYNSKSPLDRYRINS
jgi:hypothetical protein